MGAIDLDVLMTPELYIELCNIIERGRRDLPLPGQPGDDGMAHTSDRAEAVGRAVFTALRRAGRAAQPTMAELLASVRRDSPGHTDEWYAAYLARRAHFASGGDMSKAPGLPAGKGPKQGP